MQTGVKRTKNSERALKRDILTFGLSPIVQKPRRASSESAASVADMLSAGFRPDWNYKTTVGC